MAITITQQPSGGSCYVGDGYYLTCRATETTGAPLAYNWYRDGSLVGTGQTHKAKTSSAGSYNYYCRVSSPNGSVNSNTVRVLVIDIPRPVIVTQPQGFTEYIGKAHNVICHVNTVEGITYKYKWYLGGTQVAETSEHNYGYIPTKIGDAEAYVTVTASVNSYSKSETSNTFTVKGLRRTAYITQQPASGTISVGGEGEKHTFYCMAVEDQEDSELVYEWYGSFNGGSYQKMSGTYEQQYTSCCPVDASVSGTWKVYCSVYANNKDSGIGNLATTSSTATLIIQMPETPVFITNPDSHTYIYDEVQEAIPLYAEATVGTGYLTYKWYQSQGSGGWLVILGATGTSYTPDISAIGTKLYRCKATNTDGTAAGVLAEAWSDAATITVKKLEAPTFTKNPADRTLYRGGTDAQVTATATAPLGNVGYKLQESSDGSSWTDASDWQTTASTTVSSDTPGVKHYRYAARTVYVYDDEYYYSDTVYSKACTITVADTPVPTVLSEQIADAEYNLPNAEVTPLKVTCYVPAGTVRYTWYRDGSVYRENTNTITPPINAEGTHTYYCRVTNTLNGYETEYISASARIVVDYVTITITQQPRNGTYFRGQTADDLHCTATDSRGFALTYTWQENSTGTVGTGTTLIISTNNVGVFKYNCLVRDSIGVSVKSNIATITVKETPVPVLSGSADLRSAEYYPEQLARALSAASTAESGTLSYQWQVNTGSGWNNISGATGSTYTPQVNTPGTAQYRCNVTNSLYGYITTMTTGTATITVKDYEDVSFTQDPVGYECDVLANANALRVTVEPERSSVRLQWQKSSDNANWTDISGATLADYIPDTRLAGTTYYRCTAANGTGTYAKYAVSESAKVTVNIPEITVTKDPENDFYGIGQTAKPLTAEAVCPGCVISYQWQMSPDGLGSWTDIAGATANNYRYSTMTAFDRWYRCVFFASNNGHTRSKESKGAHVVVSVADPPVFIKDLLDATYDSHVVPEALDGRATVKPEETLTYQWYFSEDNEHFFPITGAVQGSYTPSTAIEGVRYYYVIATAKLGISTAIRQSNTAMVTVRSAVYTSAVSWQKYLAALKTNYTKLCKLEFLQPDGSVAFSIDNNVNNRRSGAFIQGGTLTVNLQNGQRRSANITLANLDGEYDYNVNKVWFGQQIRLSEGLILPNGQEFYLPQGVFYVKDPVETVKPGERTVKYNLVDKWAYLDGTLFGNLDGIYEIEKGQNIFTAIDSLLKLDRGNGQKIDAVPALYTDWYNDQTTELPDGTVISDLEMPYTYRNDTDNGTYADIILEMNKILAGWIGYDARGRLRLDPSQDDILDQTKPIEWDFKPDETQFMGATYTVKNSEVFNDVIIVGEALSEYGYVAGRAQNVDPKSDTNVNLIGKKTYRESNSGYSSRKQCENLAVFYLKRKTVLQKSVTISSTQIFHLQENQLVTIHRPDKPGNPIERHLVTGFTRQIGQTGTMEIQATSVNDLGNATIVPLPDDPEPPVPVEWEEYWKDATHGYFLSNSTHVTSANGVLLRCIIFPCRTGDTVTVKKNVQTTMRMGFCWEKDAATLIRSYKEVAGTKEISDTTPDGAGTQQNMFCVVQMAINSEISDAGASATGNLTWDEITEGLEITIEHEEA